MCAVISQCKKEEVTSRNWVGIFPSRGDIAAGLRFTALTALMWCAGPRSLAVWQWFQRFFCRPKHRSFQGYILYSDACLRYVGEKDTRVIIWSPRRFYYKFLLGESKREKRKTPDSSRQKTPNCPLDVDPGEATGENGERGKSAKSFLKAQKSMNR